MTPDQLQADLARLSQTAGCSTTPSTVAGRRGRCRPASSVRTRRSTSTSRPRSQGCCARCLRASSRVTLRIWFYETLRTRNPTRTRTLPSSPVLRRPSGPATCRPVRPHSDFSQRTAASSNRAGQRGSRRWSHTRCRPRRSPSRRRAVCGDTTGSTPRVRGSGTSTRRWIRTMPVGGSRRLQRSASRRVG